MGMAGISEKSTSTARINESALLSFGMTGIYRNGQSARPWALALALWAVRLSPLGGRPLAPTLFYDTLTLILDWGKIGNPLLLLFPGFGKSATDTTRSRPVVGVSDGCEEDFDTLTQSQSNAARDHTK